MLLQSDLGLHSLFKPIPGFSCGSLIFSVNIIRFKRIENMFNTCGFNDDWCLAWLYMEDQKKH